MFEKIRQTLRDAMHTATAPEDRRAVVSEMKATLVQARLGLDDLRAGITRTRGRLTAERAELETVRRRRGLAESIRDAETVGVAERFERHHAERVSVLEAKLAAEERELAMVEAEVQEMTAEFKSVAGGGAGRTSGAAATAAALEDLDRDPLQDSLDALGRDRARAARESEAEERLAALKRRMGR